MEIVAAVLVIVGGGMVSAAGLPSRRPTERARELLGNSDGAVTRSIPRDWRLLLDRLD